MPPLNIPPGSILSLAQSGHSSYLANIDYVVGPLVVGVIFNSFLYGTCLLQFMRYWMYQMNDKPLIKCLVAWTFLLDTFHTCALIYMLWVYVVDHFSDVAFLANILWPFSATPIVTTLTSFPIQIYLSWRIRQFSQSLRVFAALFTLSAAQASLGIACSLRAFQIPRVTSYHQLIPIVDSWQVLAVLADGSITILLWWYLNKSRTGARNHGSHYLCSSTTPLLSLALISNRNASGGITRRRPHSRIRISMLFLHSQWVEFIRKLKLAEEA
ncbi:hypothetical protein CVT24_000889 [Panaeolus cyanescens]|uniref:Uncharacterized protein n=1 Tax=Panaeolus cyanescens TaxID=181874 RepID=A0A409YTE5_9AGAR|nr:hypothetical protein CVT24_000889 [Panaeolus cyanescens]